MALVILDLHWCWFSGERTNRHRSLRHGHRRLSLPQRWTALRLERGLGAGTVARIGRYRVDQSTMELGAVATRSALRRDVYVRTNFKAFSDGSINHPGPVWYYLIVVPASFMPWTMALLPAMAIALWRPIASTLSRWRGHLSDALWRGSNHTESVQEREQRLARLWLVSIVVFPLLFLSISASKLPYYPLPLYPALALLMVDIIADRLTDSPSWLRWGLIAQAMLVVGGVGYYLLRIVEPRQLEQIDWHHGTLAAVGAGLVLITLVVGGVHAGATPSASTWICSQRRWLCYSV